MPLLLCNGMNRSGSTLQYNLARGLVEGAGLGRGEGYILDEDVASTPPQLAEWAADGGWHVVKCHRLPPNAAALLAGRGTRIAYIYRDIRAVAASYRRIWDIDAARIDEELDRAVATYDAVLALGTGVLHQRYETVIADLETATRELATHCHLPVANSLISAVAAENAPANMLRRQDQLERQLAIIPLRRRFRSLRRRLLRRFGLWRPRRDSRRKKAIDAAALLHPAHISPDAGRPDAWREHLPPAEIDRLTARYAGWLRDAGYLKVGVG